MKHSLVSIRKEYDDELKQASVVLANRIKAVSSVKDVVALLGITRPVYYHRQKRPEAWSLTAINQLAPLLGEEVSKAFQSAAAKGQALADRIEQEREEAGLSVTFLCKKSGFTTSTYYRNMKEPHLWDLKKLEQMQRIIDTIKQL